MKNPFNKEAEQDNRPNMTFTQNYREGTEIKQKDVTKPVDEWVAWILMEMNERQQRMEFMMQQMLKEQNGGK